jgi:hypothetical protein
MPSSTTPDAAARPPFRIFYTEHFIPEHRHPLNIALHVLGTLAGLALLGAAAAMFISPWWALTFPLVHAGPGLIGHRLFERNAAVGDSRLTRTDFPLHWFIIANHMMLARMLLGRR